MRSYICCGAAKVGAASTCRRLSALEHGSDRHETLPKRVSDDPRHFNFRRKNVCSTKFFGLDTFVSPFWANFGGWTGKRTSESKSSQFFALDAPIMSSVRPKIAENMPVCVLGSGTYQQHPPCPAPPLMDQGNLRM